MPETRHVGARGVRLAVPQLAPGVLDEMGLNFGYGKGQGCETLPPFLSSLPRILMGKGHGWLTRDKLFPTFLCLRFFYEDCFS